MLDKKVTRKQFLISAISLIGIVALSKVPKKMLPKELKKDNPQPANGYGNHAYGGGGKNA